ncbi:WecB/TagA/CpsF family glycosyltransferase [candidate division CSSED10-310 bacterium]|uniref:WecB/TagA/CpsF family glycosyltransferase n=1 Tax=candidate division CSSED10-310 bacterium TaxID=2855610 RepID=A0ABV6YYR6_UNCC1
MKPDHDIKSGMLSIRERKMTGQDKINILGAHINPLSPAETLELMMQWIKDRERHYICVCAVHIIMECLHNHHLQQMVNQASLAVPDGMPLVWVSKLYGYRNVRRVYGPNLMLSFCELAAQKNFTNFLLGGAVGQPEILAHNLTTRFPGLKIAGYNATPKRPIPEAENKKLIEEINACNPDVVWVGMGTPFQEYWVGANRSSLNAPILIGVGAAFDIHSKRVYQAPTWLQRLGLEWMFRLIQEPRRLWRRYLIGNPLFVWKLVCQWLGISKYK